MQDNGLFGFGLVLTLGGVGCVADDFLKTFKSYLSGGPLAGTN